MSNRIWPLLPLALLMLIPQGLASAIYSSGAADIAGALGLSLDEASWFNVLFMVGQLLALPLASWAAYRLGNRRLLRSAAALGLGCALISVLVEAPLWQYVAWLGHGVCASVMVVLAHRLVMTNLDFVRIAKAEAVMLLLFVLVPMGLYPLLMGLLAEAGGWRWAFALQWIPYAAVLYWVRFGPWPWPDTRQRIRLNLLQAGLLSGFIVALTVLLMKGERYNWFRDPDWVVLAVVTALLGAGVVLALRRGWGRGEYLRPSILRVPNARVGMVNGAVAGFVVMAATMLTSGFVTGVLGYSHAQLGQLERISFYGMLLGLMLAIKVTTTEGGKPEKVIPLGVLLMVIACSILTGVSPDSGRSDLWPAMLLKGVAVGILNVTVTIHILRRMPKAQLVEAIAWFYLFRNLGSLLASVEFSRLQAFDAANASLVMAGHLSSRSDAFVQQSLQLQQAVGGHSAALIGQALQQQVASVASINGFQWLIASIGGCTVLMISAMKWAQRQSA
ncbi:MFS transporter [Ferrimonas kyonanensis]|uniref:MFS transporter n=1 Tax=Ferrimonas kyonanensis TaxID=364763 RepID=UPI00041CC5F1|nr:MFS transporter [Ferrimonas kyonanensis]